MSRKLSAVIITYNEEANIGRCLESIQGLVDEVVVVDSFSEDETKSICEKYNVRFVQRAWQGYSKTKNYANSLASNEYVLSLDADEVLSDELKVSIAHIKSKGFSGAYSFNRLTNYCGAWIRHGGWYPDNKVRIFKKTNALWEGDFVHETLELKPFTKVNPLDGDLLHYSYHCRQDHLDRIESYSTLHAQKMWLDGRKYSVLNLVFSPIVKFIKTYVLQLGILDGYPGWLIANYSARAVALKYKKLRLMNDAAG